MTTGQKTLFFCLGLSLLVIAFLLREITPSLNLAHKGALAALIACGFGALAFATFR